MARKDNLLGIEKFEMGPVGDGIMGAALTTFGDIEIGSPNIEGQTATENTIPTEDNDAYITLNADVTPTKFKIRLYGVAKSDYPMILGGTYAGSKWSEPKIKPNIFLSTRITGTAIDGFKNVVEMAYAKVNAKIQGTITKDKLPAIDIEITANVPVSAAQVEGAAVTIEEIAA